jgi:hypothetical protein
LKDEWVYGLFVIWVSSDAVREREGRGNTLTMGGGREGGEGGKVKSERGCIVLLTYLCAIVWNLREESIGD